MPWRPPSDPWALKVVLGSFLVSSWTLQNRPKWSCNLTKNQAPIWMYIFGCLEASGGRLGLDFGVILGSILGSRARHATFTKNSTAPQREHDFQGFGESKNETNMDPKVASSGNLATRASWEPPRLDFQAFGGSFWGSQIGRKTLPKMS